MPAASSQQPPSSTVESLLDAAVEAMGGARRPGQHQMAGAVSDAITGHEHLLVQAGTGTGKSLAYLVPALQHATTSSSPVVVSTATIALQRQLVERDLPLLVATLEPQLRHRPTFTLLKGRQNYLCLQRLEGGEDPSDEGALFEAAPTSKAGRDALRIREWATTTTTGDRDELVPAPDDRAWRSYSVSAHECLGAQRCPMGAECYAEAARERARESDVVVTNHAMLAIDAMSEARLLPDHDVVVVDEGHELVDRATGAVTDELTAAMVERAARRSRRLAGETAADLLLGAAGLLEAALEAVEPGRLRTLPSQLFDALVAVRDAGHAALTAIGVAGKEADDLAARIRSRAAVEEVHQIAGRIVAAAEHDVVWVSRRERRPASLWRAPLQVGALLAERLFAERTVVLTSATLALGGTFEPLARNLGLGLADDAGWRGLDVGSPFDYQRQAILYVAAHLDPPGRDGLSAATLDELTGLVESAGGRTLGLFSSMRAAQQAAEELRERVDLPILCQGEDATAELVRQFAADARTSLFGTLSLWQGVDVPGSSLHLVVIDRIPFPRPDDPVSSARQEAVARAGGNGFMAVAASQAALRLAQGAGRLIRNATDRGVVAVLDSRLASARYAGFLRASLPPMWPTTDNALVRRSLASIAESAPAVLPVRESVVTAAAEVAAATDAGQTLASPDSGERRGRRWTDEEEQAMLTAFDGGTPVLLVAEELGRSPGAVTARLRQRGRVGRVVWSSDVEPPKADRELAYSLALAAAAAALPDPERSDRLAELLELDGWEVEAQGPMLRVRRGGVDAVVGFEAVADAVAGDATSRLLVRPGETEPSAATVPAGVDALVLLPILPAGVEPTS